MAIVLGGVSLDEALVSASETLEETGGRDARVIVLEGMTGELASVAAVEAMLDGIVSEASADDLVALSLRAGRRLWVRRVGFSREVAREALVGSFRLKLEAPDPFEESDTETTVTWAVSASGQGQALTTSGNANALPVVTLTAAGDVVSPALSDGTRTLTYGGTVSAGSVLRMDPVEGVVTLGGEDVTAYASGDFPVVLPGGTTLTYTGDTTSSHAMTITAVYRDRWW